MRGKLEFTTAMATAVLLAGCDPSNTWSARQGVRVCRDAIGRRLEDGQCATGYGGSGGGHWFYIDRGGVVPRLGAMVSDGGFAPRPGASYGPATGGSVTRGGFGGFAERFGLSGRG